MTSDATFSFLTSQDEYHCFLEKILLRASNFYSEAIPSIEAVLIDNYVQMEKSCLKENYTLASFYYIKQLEEIILYGLDLVGLQKISDDFREKSDQDLKLSSLGDEMLNYKPNKNGDVINKITKNQIIKMQDLVWTVKVNLFKHYFETSETYIRDGKPKKKIVDFDVDTVLYYRRNHHGHANPIINSRNERILAEKIPSFYSFMYHTQENLRLYGRALKLPINR